MIKKFMGEYNHSLDSKGRLIVPSKFRDLLGDEFYVTKGLDPCLVAYTPEKWQEVLDSLEEQLPTNFRNGREMRRYLIGGSAPVEIDKQGRVLIPGNLRQFAHLEKNLVLVGAGDYFEIWDEQAWEQMNQFDSISDIAEEFPGLRF
ncbi:MAG: division/cell wall cluster transcriptional repressor MraZ [Lachnospiraceae bacterium]|nr:division/cell wall cluster transcriptional repressor MraZ [Lachnospiraceae bacterium]